MKITKRQIETGLIAEITSAGERATALEEQAAALEERTTALEEQAAVLEEQTTALGEQTSALGGQIAALADRVTALEEKALKITNVFNGATYNPGTGTGGITWTDPTAEFDHLEIEDLLNPGSIDTVAPGVGRFAPSEGNHNYVIRTINAAQDTIAEVELGETTYTFVYAANLLAATIPMTAENEIVLSFDNYVELTSSEGFSVSGIADMLNYVDQPDVKSIRLRLATGVFLGSTPYTLSYFASEGNVKTFDGQPINDIIGQSIQNGSEYAPATFVSAQIPQAEPDHLVLVMSRPVNISSHTAYALSGTTATIIGIISDGTTVEFDLSEPVDISTVESDIRLTYSGAGTTDDVGQAVAAFSARAVTNNSTNQAISIQSAEIPSNNSKSLIVIMQGAVTMPTAAGFSLTSTDQEDLPNLAAASYTLSDGTITFSFAESLLQGKSFTVAYSGAGSLKAASNGDTIRAFALAVTNNSSDAGGIAPAGSARNLGVVVLGHDPASREEVEAVMDAIHATVAAGNRANFYTGTAGGDYLILPSITIAGGNYADTSGTSTAYTGGTYTARNIAGHGNRTAIEVVSGSGYKGKNGNTQDHIVMQFQNLPRDFPLPNTRINPLVNSRTRSSFIFFASRSKSMRWSMLSKNLEKSISRAYPSFEKLCRR